MVSLFLSLVQFIAGIMPRLSPILLVLIGGVLFLVIAGCTSPPVIPAVPTVTIMEPANGATLPSGAVAVTIQVQNFSIVDKEGQANVPGEGHVHYYLDVSPIPSDPAKPALPADANAVWAHVAASSYTFTNVSPGMHTLSVQLVNNDHTPVVPLATSMVSVVIPAPTTIIPTPTTSMPTPTTMPPGQSIPLSLVAKDNAFDRGTITVPAGAAVVLTFDNQDRFPHNVALYTDSTARTTIYKGVIITGPKVITYTFNAPSQPGTYFFRCDVHPSTMTGSFIVT